MAKDENGESKKPKMGRPTVRDEDVTRRVISTLGIGLSLKTAAAYAGVAYRTLARWRETDPEFRQATEEARANAVVAPTAMIVKIMKNEIENTGTPSKPIMKRRYTSAEQMKATMWFLEHRCEEFRPRATLEVAATAEDGAKDLYSMVAEMRGSVRGPEYPEIALSNGNGNGRQITVVPDDE